ncbi:tRNA (adenosine(37)-N6)-dimethylallyltransferase MiaA [Moorella sp. Hama-1]|uniref:tRNA (adenosine(37)-N6)-dimethylallyltransferase MiaA n=1 Tax=Moorella sp. Hama-1 TaxID=2138101 RepID=UPI000D65D57C|nr:tRNA (adenosine(37)-N6)-dimethylallyltransferase MiaA [Moorella sp. Hama-1]MDN5361439.1 tRNA dimethylallyltransferase [Moorella sp. (in: firmicutes)]BCV21203.1 tRNA dimethylallyltransferase [Moorella sp. Hama-1]
MSAKEPLAAIVGPTATGKSAIALQVASHLGAEIISVDSAQVYRGMDIGTAKLTPEERVGHDGQPVPHHLIDIVDPDEPFSVADYQALARQAIGDINARGRLPILVGGTGLYYQAVVDPYRFTPEGGDPRVRRELEELAIRFGNEYLYERLQRIDPEAARRIHPHDRRRLVRALEVYQTSGQPISAALAWRRRQETPYRLAAVALTMPRPLLYERIEARVDAMLARGLVEEVARLLARYDYRLPALQALGYKEIGAYLRHEMSLEEAVALLKRNTRRLAKRQLTWFRRDKRLRWWEVDPARIKEISTAIASFISRTIDINVE